MTSLLLNLAAALDAGASVPQSWLVLIGLAVVILMMVLFGIFAISATGRAVRLRLHQRRRAQSEPNPIDPWAEAGRRVGEDDDHSS